MASELHVLEKELEEFMTRQRTHQCDGDCNYIDPHPHCPLDSYNRNQKYSLVNAINLLKDVEELRAKNEESGKWFTEVDIILSSVVDSAKGGNVSDEDHFDLDSRLGRARALLAKPY